jgi:hypothetical protein
LDWLADFEANPNGFYAWFEFLLVRLLNVRQGGRFGLASRLRSESEWILRVVRIYSFETGEFPIRKGRFGLASSLRSKIICVQVIKL